MRWHKLILTSLTLFFKKILCTMCWMAAILSSASALSISFMYSAGMNNDTNILNKILLIYQVLA